MSNSSKKQTTSSTFKKPNIITKNEKTNRDISCIINPENPYDLKEEDIEDIEKLTNSTIIQSIGSGGFSTVKLIYNKCHNTYFAMKIIHLKNKKFKRKSQSKNREFIFQEIIVNFNTRNKNIIKLYGYYQHKHYILLILEYMNNKDLKAFMKKHKNKKFSEALTASFILQVLKSLGYLKMWPILHRDIKPENIMLNTNYTAKLGDFSLARKVDINSKINASRSGTLPYLSPECVKKETTLEGYNYDKLDLFSLGVVMYILLFNKHPYNYQNSMTHTDYAQIIDNSVLSFPENRITKACEDFLRGILEKDIEKRFNYERCINHPWVYFIKEKVEQVKTIYSNDPEKMIRELENLEVKDSDFDQEIYSCNQIKIKDEEKNNLNLNINICNKNDLSLNKKRKRTEVPLKKQLVMNGDV